MGNNKVVYSPVSFNGTCSTIYNLSDRLYGLPVRTITLTEEEFDYYQRWKAKFQLQKISTNTSIWELFWQNN